MDAAVDDAEDFAAFYRAHFARVAGSVRPLAGDAADDVAQEAFLALYERWDEVRGYDAPIAWVRLVATRIAIRRAARELKRLELEQAARTPSADVPRDPDLHEAIRALPAGQAAAVTLHHLDDRSVADVARALDCSVSAAKVWLHRGRRRLAERVRGYRGRWISERRWSVDDVASHLADRGVGGYTDAVLAELAGRGGRWEMTFADGRYVLERDDGMLLDHGRFTLEARDLVLHPAPAPGRVVFAASPDGPRLALTPRLNTTPPTRGVPDDVWMGLFLGASPLVWSGPPSTAAV